MALKIKKTFDNGVVADNCYVKIGRIEFSPMETISVIYYFNEEARMNNLSPLEVNNMQMPVVEGRSEVYTKLKALPGFEEAIDA